MARFKKGSRAAKLFMAKLRKARIAVKKSIRKSHPKIVRNYKRAVRHSKRIVKHRRFRMFKHRVTEKTDFGAMALLGGIAGLGVNYFLNGVSVGGSGSGGGAGGSSGGSLSNAQFYPLLSSDSRGNGTVAFSGQGLAPNASYVINVSGAYTTQIPVTADSSGSFETGYRNWAIFGNFNATLTGTGVLITRSFSLSAATSGQLASTPINPAPIAITPAPAPQPGISVLDAIAALRAAGSTATGTPLQKQVALVQAGASAHQAIISVAY